MSNGNNNNESEVVVVCAKRPNPLEPKSDIIGFLCGVLLFELLVGKSPFHDRSAYKIKERIKHKYKLPDWPSPMECPYSQEFRDLVSKLLQKTPSNRLGSQGGAD